MNHPQHLTDQLYAILADASAIYAELVLAGLFLLVVLGGLVLRQRQRGLLYIIAIGGLAGVLMTKVLHAGTGGAYLYSGMLYNDGMAVFFHIIFIISAIITICFSLVKYQSVQWGSTEFVAMIIAMVLGLNLMALSANLLMLYLSLELVSICSYILVATRFTKKGTEAGIKYVVYGALASGIMLYGISLLYGLTGTLAFTEAAFYGTAFETEPAILVIVLLLFFGGLFFKVAVFPFQLWVPDVYEGAPTPVTAFLSVAPKAAGFVVLTRFFFLINEHASRDFQDILLPVMVVIVLVTLTIGNFAALWQKSAKRMLAYSSVAHAGVLLSAVLVSSQLAVHSIAFYLFVYMFMNFAAFLVVEILSREMSTVKMDRYKGVGLQYPWLGVAVVIIMAALTGLPPTGGFTAKLLVFSSVWQEFSATGNKLLLVVFVFGLFNTVVSLFYYLKIPYFMFFKPAPGEYQFVVSNSLKVFVSLLVLPVLVLFFKADWLLKWLEIW